MNAAQFFEAARKAAPKVFGLQLQPFTVGHYLFLAELDSPFLPSATREPSARDALIATFICAGDSEQQRLKLQRNSLWFYWWVLRVGRMPIGDIDTQSKLLALHIRSAFIGPSYKLKNEGQSRKANAPHVLGIINFFMEELSQPRSEILATPLWEALSQRATYLDRHGELNVWTEELDDLLSFAKTQDPNRFKRN